MRKVKSSDGATVKASLNRAEIQRKLDQSVGVDPKPGDLSMSRLKLP